MHKIHTYTWLNAQNRPYTWLNAQTGQYTLLNVLYIWLIAQNAPHTLLNAQNASYTIKCIHFNQSTHFHQHDIFNYLSIAVHKQTSNKIIPTTSVFNYYVGVNLIKKGVLSNEKKHVKIQ